MINFGVLSTAKIGKDWVVPAIERASGARLAAVASRSEAPASTMADEFSIPSAYGSYEELIADPNIDAIYNPLPNHLHLEWTMAAIAAGKHVLCEKPLGMNADEARTMVDAATAAGVVMTEAFMYRWHPQWVKAKELVDEGRIGDIVSIQSWFSYYGDDPSNIRHQPHMGGGALMDIGCYPIHVTRLFLGDTPTDVSSSMRIHPDYGVDVATSAILDYGNVQSTFTVSTQAANTQRVSIQGTKGALTIEPAFNIPIDLPGAIIVTGDGPPWDLETELIGTPAADQYAVQVEGFCAAIGGTPQPFANSDPIANMTIIDRVFAASGRTSSG